MRGHDMVLVAEAADHVEEFLRPGDRLAEVAKLVGERLQAGTIPHYTVRSLWATAWYSVSGYMAWES